MDNAIVRTNCVLYAQLQTNYWRKYVHYKAMDKETQCDRGVTGVAKTGAAQNGAVRTGAARTAGFGSRQEWRVKWRGCNQSEPARPQT